MTFGVLRQYLEHASGSGRRSTVLSTLIIMGGVLLAGIVAATYVGAPEWLLRWVLVLLVGDGALFGVAFLYFMIKSPDALRSERFELEKMAMERGLLGDSIQGEVSPDKINEVIPVSANSTSQIEGPE